MLANADNQSAFVADEKRRLLHPPLEGEGRRDRLKRSSRGGVKLAAPAPPEGFTPPRSPPRAEALGAFATLPFQGRVKQGRCVNQIQGTFQCLIATPSASSASACWAR